MGMNFTEITQKASRTIGSFLKGTMQVVGAFVLVPAVCAFSVLAGKWIAAVLCVFAVFCFLSDRRFWITSRVTAALIVVVCALHVSLVAEIEEKGRLADLRSTDPNAYLQNLRLSRDASLFLKEARALLRESNPPRYLQEIRGKASDDEYMSELKTLDSPSYEAEMLRRKKEADDRAAEQAAKTRAEREALERKAASSKDLPVAERRDLYEKLASLAPERAEYRAEADRLRDALDREAREDAARPLPEQKANLTESQAVLGGVATRIADSREHLKKYYATPHQVQTAAADLIAAGIIKAKYEDAKTKEGKALQQKASALFSELDTQVRVLYASSLEQVFLKSGMNAEVSVSGTKKDMLRIKYALMSKVLVYKFQNDTQIDSTAKLYGFSKLVYTDGFDDTWTVDLKAK
jgi:hypothetical protein